MHLESSNLSTKYSFTMAVPVLERRRKQYARGKKNNIHKISTVAVIMVVVMTMTLLNQQASSTSSSSSYVVDAFQACRPTSSTSVTTTSSLWMGKLRNKQAELQRKMEAAKKARMQEEKGQNEDSSSSSAAASTTSSSDDSESKSRLSDEEMKELNDRKRFEQLLSSSIAMSPNDGEEGGYDDDDDDETDYSSRRRGVGGGDVDMSLTYLSVNQEEENIDAYTRGVERFFEGDTAPEDVFEELVSIKSENAIGETGKKRLLPWLRGKEDDYLVVICDPRQKSPEFQDTVKSLSRFLPKDLLKKAVFVNADTPAENRRFLKKNNLMTDDDGKITLYSDEKMEWMRSYTALGHDRFSMTLFVLANGRIQKLVRELSSVNAPQVVESVIKATQKRRL